MNPDGLPVIYTGTRRPDTDLDIGLVHEPLLIAEAAETDRQLIVDTVHDVAASW